MGRPLRHRRLLISASFASLGAMTVVSCNALRVAETPDSGPDGTLEEEDGASSSSSGGPDKRDGAPTKEAGKPAPDSSVSTRGKVEIIASGFTQPYEIALTSDMVFFTLSFDTQSTVRKVRKDGTQDNVIVAEYDASSGLNPLGEDLVIVGDEVVWINGTAGAGGIYAAPVAGGPVRRIKNVLDKPSKLAYHGGELFFVDEAFSPYTYAVQRMPFDGGKVTLVADYQIRVGGIAADPSGVYWTTAGPLANGKSAVRTHALADLDAGYADLAVGTDNLDLGNIVITANDVFWADTGEGRIMRIAKSGGPKSVLAEDLDEPLRIALDATHVYFTTRKAVSRVPRTGGAVEPFVTAIDLPVGIAVDDTHVYWAAYGSGEIGRIHK